MVGDHPVGGGSGSGSGDIDRRRLQHRSSGVSSRSLAPPSVEGLGTALKTGNGSPPLDEEATGDRRMTADDVINLPKLISYTGSASVRRQLTSEHRQTEIIASVLEAIIRGYAVLSSVTVRPDGVRYP